MTDRPHPPSSGPSERPSDRLDSWKEIARYLKRDESTVQRWEKREGMPVHRHLHDKRGSVYAFGAELDGWWQSRRQQLDHKRSNGDEPATAPAEVPVLAPETHAQRSRRAWWIPAAVVLGVAGVLTLVQLPLRWPLLRPANPTLVRVTSTSGVNIDPALSIDGSLLAYASDRGEGDDLDIWVQPGLAEEPTRVTDAPGDELEPSFSPDGASIVFVKGASGGIYVVGAVGGEPRLLATAARAHSPRFSPDGRWVTYWTGLPAWVVAGAPIAAGALFIVEAAGGTPRAIAPGFADSRHPVWSPDGEKLLFLGRSASDDSQDSLDWYVVDRDGGRPTRTGAIDVLRKAGVAGLPIPGGWNRNGVTFATYDEGASNVWQLGLSASSDRVVGTPTRLTFGTAIERSPSVSAAGRVAFTSLVENVDVWRVRLSPKTGLASGDLERVTDNAAIDRVINVTDDGRTLALSSSRTGREEIWIRDLESGKERQVTFSNAREGRISHDGSVLAVARDVADQSGVDLLPLSGGPPAVLCDDCANPDWSPDDSRLLVRKGQGRLVVHERASGRETDLTAHPTWALYRSRFSPDGRWVVFHTANSPSLRQVYAVPTFGNGPVPVENWTAIVPDFGMHANWSLDGSGVYHFSLRDGAFCAWLQPVDATTKRPIGAPEAVKHFHQPGLQAVSGAMVTNHVAAGYLYLTLTQTTANIWILQP